MARARPFWRRSPLDRSTRLSGTRSSGRLGTKRNFPQSFRRRPARRRRARASETDRRDWRRMGFLPGGGRGLRPHRRDLPGGAWASSRYGRWRGTGTASRSTRASPASSSTRSGGRPGAAGAAAGGAAGGCAGRGVGGARAGDGPPGARARARWWLRECGRAGGRCRLLIDIVPRSPGVCVCVCEREVCLSGVRSCVAVLRVALCFCLRCFGSGSRLCPVRG